MKRLGSGQDLVIDNFQFNIKKVKEYQSNIDKFATLQYHHAVINFSQKE